MQKNDKYIVDIKTYDKSLTDSGSFPYTHGLTTQQSARVVAKMKLEDDTFINISGSQQLVPANGSLVRVLSFDFEPHKGYDTILTMNDYDTGSGNMYSSRVIKYQYGSINVYNQNNIRLTSSILSYTYGRQDSNTIPLNTRGNCYVQLDTLFSVKGNIILGTTSSNYSIRSLRGFNVNFSYSGSTDRTNFMRQLSYLNDIKST